MDTINELKNELALLERRYDSLIASVNTEEARRLDTDERGNAIFHALCLINVIGAVRDRIEYLMSDHKVVEPSEPVCDEDYDDTKTFQSAIDFANSVSITEKKTSVRVDYACCSSCGKRVSNSFFSLGPVFIRAYIQCPECVEKEAK